MTPNFTPSAIDHYGDQTGLRVIWGTLNGVPIYMPMGTTAIIVSSEWLKANPPKPKT